MVWTQSYDPLHNPTLSTLLAAMPLVVLLGSIAILRIRVHWSALLGLAVALVIAVGIFRMPGTAAAAAAAYGAAFGLFPIGWIILNVIFLYQLTVQRGLFTVLRNSLATVAPDPRVQLILIAFCFGAFIEGLAGFGAPVAICGAILIQLGFKPLHAAGLALIANTAPVAFGSVGIPITTLAQVTGMDAHHLAAMVGRQLPFFSLIMPFWVVATFAGWRGLREVWPAALTAGAAFALPQFLVSNLHGPWLVDIVSGVCSMAATIGLLRFWEPKTRWPLGPEPVSAGPGCAAPETDRRPHHGRRELLQAWTPWVLLTLVLLGWGTPRVRTALDRLALVEFPVPLLHEVVERAPPVAPLHAHPEAAIFSLNICSATGTGILLAGVLAGFIMGVKPRQMLRTYGQTVWQLRYSLLTIAGMLALGNVTRYAGSDATLGLALARTGGLYPFFGTLLGWLGVTLTGSDTSSNVLFGNLQRITAEQIGVSPVLMGAANSSGGVMGKMLSAQSIVVASTATDWFGHERSILRFVIPHSVTLAVLMGVVVYLQAVVWPFTLLVVH
ncbi:MAG TPA: L-lactate permease [Opitutaceae bacterium]|nr:L-lactate permease [Opitutaceae bacterium]